MANIELNYNYDVFNNRGAKVTQTLVFSKAKRLADQYGGYVVDLKTKKIVYRAKSST